MIRTDAQISAAYAECRRLASQHYENFPVASRLTPADKRDALAAIYAFARCADGFADEPGGRGWSGSAGASNRPGRTLDEIGPHSRLRALAGWRQRLCECYAQGPDKPPADNAVFVALGDAARRFSLSQEHFEHLLDAFELDVRKNRHEDFESLLAYCALSANPVGRLVLEIFDHRDPELFPLSDSICTALQLTNFWQDLGVDLRRDRFYIPLSFLDRFDLTLGEVRAVLYSKGALVDTRWRRLCAFAVDRTREFFEKGRPLSERVTPDLSRQLRLTWLGGMTILDRIEASGYDVFGQRPKLGKYDFLRLYWKARRSPASGTEGRGIAA